MRTASIGSPRCPRASTQVTATLAGFAAGKRACDVSVGQVPRLEIALQISGVAEQVQVTADATVLDMSSTKTATTINSRVIEELPRGRSFNSLLQVAPGVRPEPKAGTAGVGGYQVDGASGSENVFVIDGVDVSDVRRSSLGEKDAIPFEFVQELQVKSGGFDAEFGGALGGVINVVSKSGTDVYRGEVMYQFTGSASTIRQDLERGAEHAGSVVTGNQDPRGYFRRDPDNQTLAEFFQPPEDDYSGSDLRLHPRRPARAQTVCASSWATCRRTIEHRPRRSTSAPAVCAPRPRAVSSTVVSAVSTTRRRRACS